MNDFDLVDAFESSTLPMDLWDHRAHVRVAYLYASQHDFETSLGRMRDGINKLNRFHEVPDALDRGYHETMTSAFMRLIFAANLATGPHHSSDEFCSTHLELLQKTFLRQYYSRERIMTWRAKKEFVQPDLKPLPEITTQLDEPDGFEIVDYLREDQVAQLHKLIRQQWWGKKRSLADVKRMVVNTNLMVAILECGSGKLVGYCRALTDFAFRATIYDLMVDQNHQGQGLGRALLQRLLGHPMMQEVNFIYLACEPDLSSFYEKWGFEPYAGRAEWMIKVQFEEE